MRIMVISVSLFFVVLFAGCDVDFMGENRRHAAEEEQTRREVDSMREAMTKYASGCRQVSQRRLDEASKENAELREDINRFNSAVTGGMEEKDA